MARTIAHGTGRALLLQAAEEELLARDGRLEVLPVAARASVSVGLIYRHFGSKGGLLAAVVEGFYARMDTQVHAAVEPGGSWAARERRRTRLAVDFHYDEAIAPVLLGRLQHEPEALAAEQRHLRAQIAEGTRNVRAGQRAGDIPADVDAGLAAAVMLGGVRQALAEVLTRPSPPPREQVADQLWRLVVAAVRCKETP